MPRGRLHAVIIAGGAGERFWPASRQAVPKPLLRVIGDKSLLEATVSRCRRFADPDRIWVICGREHAKAVRAESGLPAGGDTVLLQVMDKDHNAVSFIYSIFASFGSGLVVPDSGITLQNRGALFSLEEAMSTCWRRTSDRSTPSFRQWHSRTASSS